MAERIFTSLSKNKRTILLIHPVLWDTLGIFYLVVLYCTSFSPLTRLPLPPPFLGSWNGRPRSNYARVERICGSILGGWKAPRSTDERGRRQNHPAKWASPVIMLSMDNGNLHGICCRLLDYVLLTTTTRIKQPYPVAPKHGYECLARKICQLLLGSKIQILRA